jgi:glycyl-tRNA synthetase beta chain
MTDFLLELRSEEIPARMQDRARADLEKLFTGELAKAGIAAEGIVTYATPRRLALIARGLPLATQAVREEAKGPRTSAPDAALEGFLRKTGLARGDLTERDGVWFAVTERPGRATADVLAAAIPTIVRAFPWPKSMRWGEASASTESLRWVRPLQGIVAILGEERVPCEVAGIASGYATVGHRFHCGGPVTIGGAQDYVEKLRACHVIVDQDERRAIIRERAAALAAGAGLSLIEDEGLVAENAGLTEWPVPLLGRFDAGFLDVPPEVIQLTARVNQKYFVCDDGTGTLANAFVCVANIDARDGGERIVAGNEKVLAARLSDARFFYETDLKVPLKEQAKKLEKIVFHEKLGTVADKVERVAKLARWLVEEGIVKPSPLQGRGLGEGDVAPSASPAEPPLSPTLSTEGERELLAGYAQQAARLAKADLVTGMVGEFPELQGLMGGYYAAAQGEPREVWEAVRDHYKPVGQGDEVPTAPVTVAVSLADKLDTLIRFFAAGELPTGSKDPYALRRAALSIIRLLLNKEISNVSLVKVLLAATFVHYEQDRDDQSKQIAANVYFGLCDVLGRAPELFEYSSAMAERDASAIANSLLTKYHQAINSVIEFLTERLKVQQREAGVRHDLIDAVFALGGEDDLVRLLARVHALQGFVATDEGANLLAGYKRAANILKKEGWAASEISEGAHPGSGTTDQVRGDGLREAIPATGEEDPLVEVDDADFAPIVAEYARSERAAALGYDPEPAEAELINALDLAEPKAAAAVEAEDFEGAMAALASLRAPIDAFFDSVTVNDSDPAKRQARLALLARMRAAVHRVADFSRIEG